MTQYNQLTARPVLQTTCYNGTGSDIDAGYCVALDSSYAPATYGCPGVKLTSDDTDFFGVTATKIPNGKTGLVTVIGEAVVTCSAAITFGTTLSVMSDSAGKVLARTTGLRSAGIPLSTTAGTGELVKILIGGKDAT